MQIKRPKISFLRWLLVLLLFSLVQSQSVQSYFVASKKWDFSKIDKWCSGVDLDGNSVELVVGLTNFSQCSFELLNFIKEKNSKIVNSVKMENYSAVVVDVPLKTLSYFASEIYALRFVKYVEPNLKLRVTSIPNDPQWNVQWGPQKIQADWAWNATTGNSSLIVAVLDTGIDWDHPDLTVNYIPFGYDWVNNDSDPIDDNGHGTHCSGIIAAVINNSEGIAGLAQVGLISEKCFNATGWGVEDDCANAIIHAVDQGANILSLSWGDYVDSLLIRDALQYAYNHGVLMVAAAGNDGVSDKMYPAAYDEVIAVAATNQNDQPASFTNFGSWIELAAPGVSIYSTYPNDNYAYLSGTSMACPHVAGLAALVWSCFPNMTSNEVRVWLQETADDLGTQGYDYYYGHGRINARNALINFAHDLSVSLETPKGVLPGNTTTLNITVFNKGKYDENDIDVQILINNTLEHSQRIPELTIGNYHRFNHTLLPERGVLNVTVYVLPMAEEENVEDNVVSQVVVVRSVLIRPKPGDYASYRIETYENMTMQNGRFNFTYEEFLVEQFIKTRVDLVNVSKIEDGTILVVIDGVTRLVENGPSWLIDTYYFGLIETSITKFGDVVNLFREEGVVVAEHDLTIGNRTRCCWLVGYSGETLSFNNFTNHYCYFDKATGLLVKWISTNTVLFSESLEFSFPFIMTLTETNMDATPPSIAIINPKQNSIHGKTAVTVEWSGSDNETGIDKYSIYLNQNFVENSTQSSLLLNLIEGLNVIKVIAVDNAGNMASDQIMATVDLSSPAVKILSPLDGFTTNTTSIEVTWRGADNETAITNYMLYVNETYVTNTTFATFVLTSLEEGKNNIVVVAFDLAGNEANATITITIDRTTPDVSVLFPEENSVVRGIVFISFEVSQDTVQVFLFIDNATFNVTGLSSYQWDTTQVSDGVHVMKILAIDEVGNSGMKTVAIAVANVQSLEESEKFIYCLNLAAIASATVAILILVATLVFAFYKNPKKETRHFSS